MSHLRGLFVNQMQAQCSIYESGVMFARALMPSSDFDLDYIEVDSFEAIPQHYDFYAINYHHLTMAWLDPERVRELSGLRVAFVLEMLPDDPFVQCPDVFDAYCVPDPMLVCADPRVHAFGRPLESVLEPSFDFVHAVPVIGSFGFPTPGKGFELVVHAAGLEFERAIVRLNIPRGTFADPDDVELNSYVEKCRDAAKPGIRVEIDHHYMSKAGLVQWCADNTINVFFYDRQLPGLAATTDQAVSSGRPLLVSTCDTFRHIHAYLTPYPEQSLRQAIKSSASGVRLMQEDWHPDRFRQRFECVLRATLRPRAQVAMSTHSVIPVTAH